ncbi:MAG: hypothetical protein ABL921_32630 [Pirellula sp.]
MTELPASERWSYAVDPREKPASFKKRLYDLNVGVEIFCRDYWSLAWLTLEFLVAATLASVLCLTFPRILPSCILLVVAGFALLDIGSRRENGPSLLWFFPIVGTAILINCLAIYRWWVAPAPAEVAQDWRGFWLGLLLTAIGVGAFIALCLWGGRVRTNGLAGIGLSLGWGVYLIAFHGWKLVRSLFSKSHLSIQSDSSQAV